MEQVCINAEDKGAYLLVYTLAKDCPVALQMKEEVKRN